ncbi:MAG: glycine cleavage system protein H [Actinomycetia bacterium]|nr:glycine cleavage system protein H [Actinomycetes bacterium]
MKLAVLACTGLDKAEGSVAREVAIRLAEEAGARIICPVVLNCTPARYKKALAEDRLIVVDGCAIQCAGRLAAAAQKKPAQKVIVSDVVKKTGATLGAGLRLGAEGLGVARMIVDDIEAAEAAACGRGPTSGEAPAGAEGATAAVRFAGPSDFIVVVHDKYEFRIPAEGFLFNANDVWVQVCGTRARVGISDYMQQHLTDITFVDPPPMGYVVEQFGELGTVESIKATFEVISPVSGTVVSLNQAVIDAPESINEDPYGAWIVELEPTSWEQDRALLVDGPAYAAEVERKASEY